LDAGGMLSVPGSSPSNLLKSISSPSIGPDGQLAQFCESYPLKGKMPNGILWACPIVAISYYQPLMECSLKYMSYRARVQALWRAAAMAETAIHRPSLHLLHSEAPCSVVKSALKLPPACVPIETQSGKKVQRSPHVFQIIKPQGLNYYRLRKRKCSQNLLSSTFKLFLFVYTYIHVQNVYLVQEKNACRWHNSIKTLLLDKLF
jgi:hypothetical protein